MTKSQFLPRTVALLLTIALTLPTPALALRQREPEKGTPAHAGLESALSPAAGMEEAMPPQEALRKVERIIEKEPAVAIQLVNFPENIIDLETGGVIPGYVPAWSIPAAVLASVRQILLAGSLVNFRFQVEETTPTVIPGRVPQTEIIIRLVSSSSAAKRGSAAGMEESLGGLEEVFEVEGKQGPMEVFLKRDPQSKVVLISLHGLAGDANHKAARWINEIDMKASVVRYTSSRQKQIPLSFSGDRVAYAFGERDSLGVKTFKDEVEDLRRVIVATIGHFERAGVSPEKLSLVLIGTSLGGQIVPIIAHEFTQVKGVVSIVGGMQTYSGRRTPSEQWHNVVRTPPEAEIGNLFSRFTEEMLVLTAKQDLSDRNESAKGWSRYAAKPIRFVEIDDEHGLARPPSKEIIQHAIRDFVAEISQQAGLEEIRRIVSQKYEAFHGVIPAGRVDAVRRALETFETLRFSSAWPAHSQVFMREVMAWEMAISNYFPQREDQFFFAVDSEPGTQTIGSVALVGISQLQATWFYRPASFLEQHPEEEATQDLNEPWLTEMEECLHAVQALWANRIFRLVGSQQEDFNRGLFRRPAFWKGPSFYSAPYVWPILTEGTADLRQSTFSGGFAAGQKNLPLDEVGYVDFRIPGVQPHHWARAVNESVDQMLNRMGIAPTDSQFVRVVRRIQQLLTFMDPGRTDEGFRRNSKGLGKPKRTRFKIIAGRKAV